MLTDVKPYHKVEVWPRGNRGRTDTYQWNRENPEGDLHKYAWLILGKWTKAIL